MTKRTEVYTVAEGLKLHCAKRIHEMNGGNDLLKEHNYHDYLLFPMHELLDAYSNNLEAFLNDWCNGFDYDRHAFYYYNGYGHLQSTNYDVGYMTEELTGTFSLDILKDKTEKLEGMGSLDDMVAREAITYILDREQVQNMDYFTNLLLEHLGEVEGSPALDIIEFFINKTEEEMKK